MSYDDGGYKSFFPLANYVTIGTQQQKDTQKVAIKDTADYYHVQHLLSLPITETWHNRACLWSCTDSARRGNN